MSTYTPIASQTLGSAAASVTFSSIPQGYTDLVIVTNMGQAIVDTAATSIRFNGDTGNNYSYTRLLGSGSAASSLRESNISVLKTGIITSSSITSPDTIITQINNYSNSTTYKTAISRSASTYAGAFVSLWRSVNPITSVTLLIETSSASNIASGSTFSLYGIQVGTAAQKAQGGNIVTSDGTYVYHTFTSSGSFIPSQALTVDYLVVAGGGGSAGAGGGGGAGGLRSTVTATGGGGSLETALSLTSGNSYPVIIGAGGVGSNGTTASGGNGSNSIFATITSTGGGGAGEYDQPGATGGSGGGGGWGDFSEVGGSRTSSPVQGYAGGNNSPGGSTGGGGGGGGAGAAGSNASGTTGGTGGTGTSVSITGSSVTYAGGGGGWGSGTGGTGGAGGGGNGSTGSSGYGNAGTVNTGGGAGGAWQRPSANGGSGIVIIRYLA